MRPRTETERRMCEYANLLPPLESEIRQWGFDNLFKPEAYYWRHRGNKHEIWCQCCGHREPCDPVWSILALTEDWTCPHCGKSCKVRRRKVDNTPETIARWMSVIDVRFGTQVVRTFEVYRDNSEKGDTQYYVKEIYQNWITERGTEVITSRPSSNVFYRFAWQNGPYEIKRHGDYSDVYAAEDNYFYPRAKVAGYFREKGLGARMFKSFVKMRIPFPSCLGKWTKIPYYETLWKAGEQDLFKYFMSGNYGRKLENYKDSIRVARKHGFEFDDVQMWLDYVDELRELGMDDRSPRYICPKDLRTAHADTHERINRKRTLEKEKKELAEMIEIEKSYSKHIAPFLGLCFATKDIEIRPLETVRSVYDEGKAMHHCIYQMGYYKRSDILLMSARNMDGKRLESIEVNLRDYTIVQSRGLQNTHSEQHEAILALLKKNMKQIKSLNYERK